MTVLAVLGAATLGVWTRADALALLTPGQLDHLVATGTWQRIHRGTYADGGYVLGPVQRAAAAALATGDAVVRPAGSWPRAVVCGRSAARVYGLPLIDDDDPATGAYEADIDDVHTFRATGSRSRRITDDRLVRHRLTLGPDDLWRHESGLSLTSPLRTAVDCARLLTLDAAVCLLDAGLHQELFSVADLAGAVQARRGRPGVRRFAAAVSLADGRAESPAETLARLTLTPSLPGLQPQVRVLDSACRVVARLDLGDEAVKLGVETDGKRGHAGPSMVAKDQRRDRRTTALGWCVERVMWPELRRTRAQVLARVVARYALLAR